MDSRNNYSTGKDVADVNITNCKLFGGDDVDAYPGFLSNILKREEKIKIGVHQNKDDLYYNTNHARRGIAVIFNHEIFDPHLNLERRRGTEADCQNLEATLRRMNFMVVVHRDLNFEQLDAVLDELSASNFNNCDCLFIAVLSHGEENVIYAKNRVYPTNVLFDRFTPDKCPTLAGKPKLYVIQACQGAGVDPGVDVKVHELDSVVHSHQMPPRADGEIDKSDSTVRSYRIPLYADFLFAYSTIPFYYSWRNPETGSWFIQAFCKEFNQYWQDFDFLRILTFVNRRVAYNYESHVPHDRSMHGKKQISSFTSQLTRILRFFPKLEKNGGLKQ